jgi:hypothetical protein
MPNNVVKKEKKLVTTIQPDVFQAILLDDIHQKLKQNNELLVKTIELQNKSIELLNKFIDMQVKDNELLNKIHQEQINEADEGQIYKYSGTATDSVQMINIFQLFGNPVKSYEIYNDGTKNIYITHNLYRGAIGFKEKHTPATHPRFTEVRPNEKFSVSYNRRKINMIHYMTSSGTSDFRLWLLW